MSTKSGKTTALKTAKPKVTKPKKEVKVEEPVIEVVEKKEPKKRASRAKKQPTKEEIMKELTEASAGLKKLNEELKEDETKLQSVMQSMQLKQVPELIKSELKNLEDELADIDEQYKEISSIPESEAQEE